MIKKRKRVSLFIGLKGLMTTGDEWHVLDMDSSFVASNALCFSYVLIGDAYIEYLSDITDKKIDRIISDFGYDAAFFLQKTILSE